MTLVEVLIGLVLLAMLTAVIAGGIRITARAWGTAETRTTDGDASESARLLLRRMIAGARPSFATQDPADTTILFQGGPDRLLFVAPEPGSWSRVALFVDRDKVSQALFLSWQPDLPGLVGAGGSTLLLDHVASVRFSYFGRQSADEAPTWLDQWTGRTDLPILVRVAIQRDDPRLPPMPDQIIRTRVTTNPGCLYDPNRQHCQRAQR